MKITQLSVFLENKRGRLREVTSLLADAQIDIKSLFLADTKDFGVLRMLVSDSQKALALLKDDAFVANLNDVIAVEVEDKPGGLDKILSVFEDNKINVEYMYAFPEKSGNNAIMIFKIDNDDKAIEALKNAKIPVLKKIDLKQL